MREAIEQVVKQLENASRKAAEMNKLDKSDAYNAAAYLIKEILANE